MSAVQVSPSEVLVEYHNTGTVHNIKADIHIRGVFTTKVRTPVMIMIYGEGGGGGICIYVPICTCTYM